MVGLGLGAAEIHGHSVGDVHQLVVRIGKRHNLIVHVDGDAAVCRQPGAFLLCAEAG